MSDEELSPEIRLQGAREWAASIQKRFAERHAGQLARTTSAGSWSLPAEYRERMRRTVAAAGADPAVLDEQFDRTRPAKLGDFDEPTTRELMQRLVDELVETMTRAGLSPGGRQVLISSVPSGLVNAFCAANTWDEDYHHVFVDSDLMVFCSLLAKIVATCFTRGVVRDDQIDFDSPRIVANARSSDMARRIDQMYAAIVYSGTVRASEPWMPDPAALPMQIRLNMAMERFVVAHELSHLMLGHLDGAAQRVQVVEEGFQDVEATLFSHEAEHEADLAGSVLATEAAVRGGQTNALTSVAPYVFLKGVDALDACLLVHGRATGGIDSTHPKASDRLAFVRAAMERHMATKDPDGNLPVVLKRVDQVFHWIKTQAVNGVRRRAAAGMKPRLRQSLKVFEEGRPPAILGLRADPGRLARLGDALAGRPAAGAAGRGAASAPNA